jgi:hypothetical protein
MSVVLKENTIIITIEAADTEEAIFYFQQSIIKLLSDQNSQADNDNYYALWLLREMMPDKESFKYWKPGYSHFNPEPLRRILEEAGPGGVIQYLQRANRYLGNIVDQGPRKLDVIDSINHIKGLIEAIEEGMTKEVVK